MSCKPPAAFNAVTITPHVGVQRIPNQPGNLGNYTDYALTLGKDFGSGISGTAALIGTNTKSGAGTFYRDFNNRDLGKSTLVVGVKYSF